MKKETLSKVLMAGAMFIFGTLAPFVRNIGVSSGELALYRAVMAAVLVGDESFVHVGWKGRLACGVTAGVVTVLCRLWWHTDGSAVGVLAAAVLTPILHGIYHGLCHFVRFLMQKFAKTEN